LDRLAGRPEGHATVIESRGDSPVKSDTASAYASVLGVSLDWLIDGSGDPPTALDVTRAVEHARANQAHSPKPAT